jgi:hypothetical protein
MRPWIEKLAKISKERGTYLHLRIIVDNLIWDIDYFSQDRIRDCYLHIRDIVDNETERMEEELISNISMIPGVVGISDDEIPY